MACFAVGDIQGCSATLQRLLQRIDFGRRAERLWLVGDLVNRGPDSLGVLRWARAHEERLVCVLGNHDLHLLGVAAGVRSLRPKDTLRPLLEAPDRDALLGWLRHRPLLHQEGARLLVHAGLAPEWTAAQARDLAHELELGLRHADGRELLQALEQPAAPRWDDALRGARRLSTVAAYLTRVRLLTPSGARLDDYKGPPEQARHLGSPWFEHPGRRTRDVRVVCGHWAALGLRVEPGLLALDTGCVWGQTLTAVRLDDDAVFQEPNAETS